MKKEDYREIAKDQEKAAHTMIKDIGEKFVRSPEEIAEYLAFGSRFYQYSLKNSYLIYGQNKNATFVQSFEAWKKMGCSVLKGEKSLKVFVPVKSTILIMPSGEEIPLSRANKDQKAAYKAGYIESFTRLHFKLGNVFDISQTNFPKENYPQMFHMGYPSELHNRLNKGLIEYCQENLQCPVKIGNVESISLRGIYRPATHDIVLNDKMEDTQLLSTLTHEMGHAILHQHTQKKSIYQIELEADAVSVMLQSSFGIELTKSRQNHLAEHYQKYMKENQDHDPDAKLQKVIENVNKIFKEHIEGINECVDRYLPEVKLEQKKEEIAVDQEPALPGTKKRNIVLEEMREDMGMER